MAASDAKTGLASWEKHTKGIGGKLLQKFGFKGRLGAREDGISASIEVVVRPTNQGLGFGDTKEAPALKANKKLEAEWRGKEYVSDEEAPDTKIEKIASSKLWKKGSRKAKENNINVDEFIKMKLLESKAAKPQVIIDMRGKETRIITDIADSGTSLNEERSSKPKLGQELLYNINTIADLMEMEVEKNTRELSREASKLESLTSDLESTQKQWKSDHNRHSKLIKMLQALERIYEELNTQKREISMKATVSMIEMLHEAFGEEFLIFGIINLLPSMLALIVRQNSWNPLQEPHVISELYTDFTPLLDYFDRIGEHALGSQTRESFAVIVEKELVPVARRSITNDWKVDDPDSCVQIMESLQAILPPSSLEQLLEMLILPKLKSFVNSWRVSSSNAKIHTVVQPWLPLMRSKLSVLYPEIRRKIHSYFTSWNPTDVSAISVVDPWMSVFDAASMENLLVKSLLPKLAEILREKFEVNPSDQQLDILNCVLCWQPYVPAVYMSCLLAGEVFPRWLAALHHWLLSDQPNYQEIIVWYNGWKSLIPIGILSEREILASLDIALVLMNESSSGDNVTLHRYGRFIERLSRDDYTVLLDRRKFALKSQRRLEDIEQEVSKANVKRMIGQSSNVSFREVVQSFAEINNVEFSPKIGKMFEDKQVWQFGKVLCYLDQQVVFYLKDNNSTLNKTAGGLQSEPIALDDLLKIAT